MRDKGSLLAQQISDQNGADGHSGHYPPEHNLWVSVLERWVRDIAGRSEVPSQSPSKYPKYSQDKRDRVRGEALRWCYSVSFAPSSYQWVCQQVNIEPKRLIASLKEGGYWPSPEEEKRSLWMDTVRNEFGKGRPKRYKPQPLE